MDKAMRRSSKGMTIFKDLLFAYIVTGLLLLLIAFIMLKFDVSNKVLSGAITGTYVVSTFVGGFLMGKTVEHRRFLWGLGMGALYFAILLLISVLTNSFVGMEVSGIINGFIMCILGGMLGGMVS